MRGCNWEISPIKRGYHRSTYEIGWCRLVALVNWHLLNSSFRMILISRALPPKHSWHINSWHLGTGGWLPLRNRSHMFLSVSTSIGGEWQFFRTNGNIFPPRANHVMWPIDGYLIQHLYRLELIISWAMKRGASQHATEALSLQSELIIIDIKCNSSRPTSYTPAWFSLAVAEADTAQMQR